MTGGGRVDVDVVDDVANASGATLEATKGSMRQIREGVERARALRKMAEETREGVRELSGIFASGRDDDEDGVRLSALERLLRDARSALRPGERAEAAIEALERDERRLFATWETLATLDVDLCAIRAALERVDERKRGVFDDEEFARVDRAWSTFETVLWSGVRQSILTAESGSVGLVRAMRVVAEQEILDGEFERDVEALELELETSASGTMMKTVAGAPPAPRRWKTRVLEEMANAVEARLALIAEGFSGMVDKESIDDVLGALDESLAYLAEIFDYTIPAFPPEWRVFETVVAPTYHAGVCELLARLSSSSDTSTSDLVATVNWSQHYFTAIESLGLKIETSDEDGIGSDSDSGDDAGTTLPYPIGLVTIIDAYCERLGEINASWIDNLCLLSRTRPPKPSSDGKLWTPSDLEFFRLVTDHMSIAVGTRSTVFIRRCGRLVAKMIFDYTLNVGERLGVTITSDLASTPSRTAMREPVAFESIVAGVNDTRRCRTLALDAYKVIKETIGDDAEISASFDQIVNVLNALHAEARRMISRQVLEDPALHDVFQKLYLGGSEGAWASGEAMTTILATVEDYLSDVDLWLVDELARSVTETLFEHLIERLFLAFTKQLGTLVPHTIPRLEEDERALVESMSLRMSHNKSLGRISRLTNLRELVNATDADAFTRAYEVLLGNWPEAGLDAVDAILRARRDLDKASARKILEQCRDVCIRKLAAISGAAPSVGMNLTTHGKKHTGNHRRTGSAISCADLNTRFKDMRY